MKDFGGFLRCFLVVIMLSETLAFLPFRLARQHTLNQRLSAARQRSSERKQQKELAAEILDKLEEKVKTNEHMAIREPQNNVPERIEPLMSHLPQEPILDFNSDSSNRVKEALTQDLAQPVGNSPFSMFAGIEPVDLMSADCCPVGIKSTDSWSMCESPCCPGLREKTDNAPHIGTMTVCVEPTQVENKAIKRSDV